MKKVSISFYLLFSFGNCFGQVTFQRVINFNYDCGAFDVQQTNDGNYIVTGYATPPGYNETNFYLIKVDRNGDTLWTKTYGGSSFAGSGFTVQQTTDGGYVVAGYGYGENLFVIKTNDVGDTLWTKVYSGSEYGKGNYIQQTYDGGYILIDRKSNFSGNNIDINLFKTDIHGDIIWSKTYGGYGPDEAFDVKQTSDSGYIILGYTSDMSTDTVNIYLIKTKANGDTLWTKAYGGLGDDYGSAIQQTTDGGYIITGETHSFGIYYYNALYLIKTDVNGDTLWTKTYYGTDNDDYVYDVQQTSDGGYIIVGSTNDFGANMEDVYLIKTNANGDTLWTKTYGGSNSDEGFSVRQTEDSGYIIAGRTSTFNSPQNLTGIYLIKTDANGNSGCYQGTTSTIVDFAPMPILRTNTVVYSGGSASNILIITGSGGSDSIICLSVGINELISDGKTFIYPNPSNNQLTIHVSFVRNSKVLSVSIINMLGQKTSPITHLQKGEEDEVIDVSKLSAGIYFLEVVGENERWVGKFVKQ